MSNIDMDKIRLCKGCMNRPKYRKNCQACKGKGYLENPREGLAVKPAQG